MNYYDSHLEAVAPNVSRWCNQSFTHVLCFLRFLNGNLHNKMAIEFLHQDSLRLGDVIKVLYCRNILFYCLFYYHYYIFVYRYYKLYYNSTINVYNLKIFLQIKSSQSNLLFCMILHILVYTNKNKMAKYLQWKITCGETACKETL